MQVSLSLTLTRFHRHSRRTPFESMNVCNTFVLNDSIVHIYLTDIHRTRLLALIYPPLNDDHSCTNYEPMERSTNALGDLNGDGLIDTVDMTTFITKLSSHHTEEFIVHSVLTRFPIDIQHMQVHIAARHEKNIIDGKIDDTLVSHLQALNPSKSYTDDRTVRLDHKQTWNAYLGRSGNSHYDRH
jgi:hypothetical protein